MDFIVWSTRILPSSCLKVKWLPRMFLNCRLRVQLCYDHHTGLDIVQMNGANLLDAAPLQEQQYCSACASQPNPEAGHSVL